MATPNHYGGRYDNHPITMVQSLLHQRQQNFAPYGRIHSDLKKHLSKNGRFFELELETISRACPPPGPKNGDLKELPTLRQKRDHFGPSLHSIRQYAISNLPAGLLLQKQRAMFFAIDRAEYRRQTRSTTHNKPQQPSKLHNSSSPIQENSIVPNQQPHEYPKIRPFYPRLRRRPEPPIPMMEPEDVPIIYPQNQERTRTKATDNLRTNADLLLEPHITTDEEFAVLHYSSDANGALQRKFQIEAYRPFAADPFFPSKHSSESLFLHQRANSSRYAAGFGERVPRYVHKGSEDDAAEHNMADQVMSDDITQATSGDSSNIADF